MVYGLLISHPCIFLLSSEFDLADIKRGQNLPNQALQAILVLENACHREYANFPPQSH